MVATLVDLEINLVYFFVILICFEEFTKFLLFFFLRCFLSICRGKATSNQ